MIVRGERELVTTRFRQIISLSASLSIVVGILFALCNTPFVQVWTAGKVSWQPINDLLLAVWLVICVSLHAHVGLVGQTKKFKFLRYVFFIEGLVFVGANIAFHRFGGITLMLIMSICCSLCLSFAYGLYRTRKYFALTWHQFAQWHREAGKLLLWLLPLGILTWWFTRPFGRNSGCLALPPPRPRPATQNRNDSTIAVLDGGCLHSSLWSPTTHQPLNRSTPLCEKPIPSRAELRYPEERTE